MVVASSPAVPVELIRAAGLVPLVLRGEARRTPVADACLEAGVFSQRIRCLVDAALSGALSEHVQLVLPRASDQDYKCFLYLREFQRLTPSVPLPPLYLLDVLQSDAAIAARYSCGRLRAWVSDLDDRTGRLTTDAEVHAAVVAANQARAAARRLVELRRGSPRVLGADAFPLLSSYWNREPLEYANAVNAAADTLSAAPPIARPRVLLAGTPVETPHVHRAMEDLGAVVVAELSPWGSSVAGVDVSVTGDPVEAIGKHYRAAIGARLPTHLAMHACVRELDAGVDGVAFVQPRHDDVFAWDYPRCRRVLEERGVPHVVLNVDEYDMETCVDTDRVGAFVALAEQRREALGRG